MYVLFNICSFTGNYSISNNQVHVELSTSTRSLQQFFFVCVWRHFFAQGFIMILCYFVPMSFWNCDYKILLVAMLYYIIDFQQLDQNLFGPCNTLLAELTFCVLICFQTLQASSHFRGESVEIFIETLFIYSFNILTLHLLISIKLDIVKAYHVSQDSSLCTNTY